MAGKRQRGSAWEFTVKRAGLLDKPITLTFDSEDEGERYCQRLEALLDRGIIPTEHQVTSRVTTIGTLIDQYLRDAPVNRKDQLVLGTVAKMVGTTAIGRVNAGWVDDWISEMKRVHKLAPATIRAKVGALARCCDWGMRKELVLLPDHPLRTLPDGYAQYTDTDAALAGARRVDVERDRRLEAGEHERILATIEGGVLARKQRPYRIEFKPAVRAMYLLALETAMRMREIYTLTVEQIDLPRRTIFLDRTKNGDKRQVPLSSVAVAELTAYLSAREIPDALPREAVFPWWGGRLDARSLDATSDALSKFYRGVFEQSKAPGLKFHDLRHEATSRLFERTTLSETEIMKITGHKSHRMMMRYANLRASNLADKLW